MNRCFLTVNGQEYGNFGNNFVVSQLKKEFLQGWLVIDLDITHIIRRKREAFVILQEINSETMTHFKAIKDEIIKTFEENETLVEMNNKKRS